MNKAVVFYKLPGRNEIVKKNGLIESFLKPIDFVPNKEQDIFYISPFHAGNTAFACYLENNISKFEIISYRKASTNTYDSEADFTQKVELAVREMTHNQHISKVVLARCKLFKITTEIDINSYFLNLCLSYPNAFVYAISSSITGTWIAATPEILFKANNQSIETTALAGTILKNASENWGEKELDEHHQVELFIENLIRKYQLQLSNKVGPISFDAGNLKHLLSSYKITQNLEVIDAFFSDLNPTPAVGGLPSEKAIDFITKNENLDRKFYTGFVGIKSKNTTQLFVNLRCMEIFKNHVNAYAGCGITAQSNPASEWMETENKLQTLAKFLP